MKSIKGCLKVSRIAVAGGGVASAVLVLSAPAFAHVSVQPEGEAPKGGYAVVDFKVPNERDDASTTKVEVSLPADHPLASVMPQSIDGWTVQITKSKLAKPFTVNGRQIDEAVTKVTWTATGKGIEPGYFQEFPLSVGQLPSDTGQLVFKALQTYSNNAVVRWIEPQKQGQEEPENPAPVLELTAAASSHHGSTAQDASATSAAGDTAADTSSAATDTTARVLGGAGIVVGVAGVVYGILAGRRRTTGA